MIGAGANVGPFSYLRPGTRLGAERQDRRASSRPRTRVIGDGAKVPHLSYVGDAEIGEGTNIGAGTIFANYDGVAKHRTTVGGTPGPASNNTFVAPVDDRGRRRHRRQAPSCADDVPPGALAVSAGPQRNLEGWVAAKRAGHRSRPRRPQAAGQRGEQVTGAAHQAPRGHPSGPDPPSLTATRGAAHRERNEADHREEPDGLQRPGTPRARGGGRRRCSAADWCRRRRTSSPTPRSTSATRSPSAAATPS